MLDNVKSTVLWALALLLAALYVLPIWVTPILPFTDLHAHLAIVALMRNLGEAGHLHAQVFQWGDFPVPNSFYYGSVYLLSFVFELTLANQIFLTLYVLALPLAFYRYLSAFDRDPRLTFFAFPLTYHWSLFFGFIDYSVAFVFLLLALASAKRYCEDDGRRHAIAVAFWAVLLFFSHLQVLFTFFYLAAFLFLLHHSPSAEEGTLPSLVLARWRRFITLVPALALCGIWIFRNVLAPAAGGTSHRFGFFGNLGAHDHSWLVRVSRFSEFVLNIFRNDEDMRTLYLFFLLAGVGALLGWISTRKDVLPKRSLTRLLPEVFVAAALALYLALPMHIRGLEFIYCRFAALVALLAVATLHGRSTMPKGLGTKIVILLTIATAGYHAININRHFRGWAKELGPFEGVVRSIPRGTRLLQITRDEFSAHLGFPQKRHLNQYHTIFNDGVSQRSFAIVSGRLVQYRPGKPLFDYEGWKARWGRYHRRWSTDRKLARHFQYALTHGIRAGAEHGLWRRVMRRGGWALYSSTTYPGAGGDE